MTTRVGALRRGGPADPAASSYPAPTRRGRRREPPPGSIALSFPEPLLFPDPFPCLPLPLLSPPGPESGAPVYNWVNSLGPGPPLAPQDRGDGRDSKMSLPPPGPRPRYGPGPRLRPQFPSWCLSLVPQREPVTGTDGPVPPPCRGPSGDPPHPPLDRRPSSRVVYFWSGTFDRPGVGPVSRSLLGRRVAFHGVGLAFHYNFTCSILPGPSNSL